MRKLNFIFILILVVIQTIEVHAKSFTNDYISFDIPDRWRCHLEQTEWICRSEMPKENQEAIIILTAKEIGPTDRFDLYESHLIHPIPLKTQSNGLIVSKPFKKPEYVQLNGLKWLDGFHLESEVKNYFTRYLITTKHNIAVLVTFSAHKDDYTKYTSDFSRTIQSLRIIAAKDLTANPINGIRPQTGSLFTQESPLLPSEPLLEPTTPNKKKDKTLYIALAIVLTAIGLYLLYRSQKK